MAGYFLLAIGLVVLEFLAYRGGRIWADAGRRGFDPACRLGWALVGVVAPSRYWWDARITALSSHERADLLARETFALGLSRADSLRSPLCRAEVPHAWALAPDGHPTVAPDPIECPRCDFRLDACRHCAHFLPGSPPMWGQLALTATDFTFGRCARYKEAQPVERVCGPEMACQLKERAGKPSTPPSPSRIVSCPRISAREMVQCSGKTG